MSAGVKDSEAEAFDFSIAVVSLILTLLWALNSSYECIKAKYCLQMYNRIIISNFPRNLIIIYQFFFLLFFQFFNFGHFRTISYPPDPWVPKIFYFGVGFIPGVPEMSASFKKLLCDNFFSCQ